MLMPLLEKLRELGLRASVDDGSDRRPILDVDVDGRRHRFLIDHTRRAPYPGELDNFLPRRASISGTLPLLLAPYVSEGLGRALAERGWSWADGAGNFDLRAKGLRLRQRVTSSPPPAPKRGFLPRGAGSLAIIRFLITQSSDDTVWKPTELADIAHVTQPRASQVLAKLRSLGLVERTRKGWRAHKEELLDALVRDYPGPGGSELPLYSLDDPLDVASRICETFEGDSHMKIVISADVGPDLVAPWRRPTQVIVYASSPVELEDLNLVRAAGRTDANVLLRIPDDVSVFRFPPLEVEVKGRLLRLADEAQMTWDLHDLGGDDRVEAAGHLREWLLNR